MYSSFTKISLLILLGLTQIAQSKPSNHKNLKEERQEVYLDRGETYLFGWQVDHEKKEITFDVTVKTTGFVGLGLNTVGFMRNADIVIGGVRDSGESYFQDYHGIGNEFPIEDANMDWELLDAKEENGHTFLKFKRPFETCDEEDVSIKSDLIHIIWSYGETDEIKYHGATNRGSMQFNLLDPPGLEIDLEQFPKWSIPQKFDMPKKDTSYHCTFHKSDDFGGKKHFIGTKTILNDENAIKHVHHFNVFLCRGEGHEQALDPLIGTEGFDCEEQEMQILRATYCLDLLYLWATGGKDVIIPEHVGVPIGDKSSHEYIVVETHYDNPGENEDVSVDWSFELFYQEPTRKYDGGILVNQFLNQPSHIVPPHVKEYTLAAHCSSECTASTLPPEGVNVIIAGFHAHLLGVKIKARHFRNGVELPWLLSDDNFDFNYQQARMLRHEIKILPGDHLTVECTYNSDRDGGTIYGISTKDEMCLTLMLVYPQTGLRYCSSQLANPEIIYEEFGIESLDMTGLYRYDPLITAPPHLAGRRYKEVINSDPTLWTDDLKQKLEQTLRYNEHDHSCYYTNATGNYPTWMKAKYPDFEEEYAPPQPDCDDDSTSSFEPDEPTTDSTTTSDYTTGPNEPIASSSTEESTSPKTNDPDNSNAPAKLFPTISLILGLLFCKIGFA